MGTTLGLDLGTNSIGWAIINKNGNEFSLIDKGVRIFSEGVKIEKGIESSKAAARTGYRNARKIKFRRKLRKYETLKVLAKNNMCPLSLHEVEEWRKSGFKKYPLNPEFLAWLKTDDHKNINPYFFRDLASKQKIPPLKLGRALYHIAQRRGFLSNRLDQSADGIIEKHKPEIEAIISEVNNVAELQIEIKDYFEGLDILGKNSKDLDEGDKKLKSLFNALEKIIKSNATDVEKAKNEIAERLNKKENLGNVKQEIDEISRAIKDGNFKTLGQYFYSLYNKSKIRNRYTAREEHYLEEFKSICKTQGIGDINENEQLPEKCYSGLAKDLYKAIFFQRPLKSQKGVVGKCAFEKHKKRCSVSHPDFEEYRMWTYLNTIKYGTSAEKTMRFLTQDEKLKLIPKFLRKKEHFNFEDLAGALIQRGTTFEFYKSHKAQAAHYVFNYKAKDTVSGCPVSASLKSVLGNDWKTKTYSYQTKDAAGKHLTRSVDYRDIWHVLTVANSNSYLEDYAKEKLKLDEKQAKSFSRIRLKKDFAGLSLNAITKILPYVREGLLYSHAVFMANIEKVVDKHIWNNPGEQAKIQNKIAEIIENNTYENRLLEAVNGLIQENKTNSYHYSKEAETILRKELKKKIQPTLKNYARESELENVMAGLFPKLIAQMQKKNGQGEFVKIKRLDEKVLNFLKGKNADGQVFCSDEKRLKKLYHPSDNEVFKRKVIKDKNGNENIVLGSPLISSIKNPMAMRALHQLRKVLNALILEGQVDVNTRIHIELARELNDANKRKAIQDFQNENKKNRETYRSEIQKLYFEECKQEIEPTEDDILRYRLWIEQNKQELYESTINEGESRCIQISQIIGSNPEYDIEHTIPRSISQDNSLMNKTLCSKRFNREIKKQKMPVELSNYENLKPYIQHWKEEADKLSGEIALISRSIASVTTKEAKDKKIRKRHYLTLKRNYLQGKYERFIWQEPRTGFKNSQLPDTGIITRYARAYLKSYFKSVASVKGGMVAEFRKIWGLQESEKDALGNTHYKPKDRDKHTHHTIDAITIACMTKEKYDVLATAWRLEDEGKKNEAKKLIEDAKPWATFTEDVKAIEDEILVSHHTPDTVKKQSKKIIRVRGKKQYVAETEKDRSGKTILKKDEKGKIIYKLNKKGAKIPRYRQGDTVRGSLHLETYYGAIERLNDKHQKEIKYVVRKPVTKDFSDEDVKNIVDNGIKERIKKYGLKNVKTKEGHILLPAEEKKNSTDIKKDKKSMLIKKIRVFQPTVKHPLEIKEHAALSTSKHKHKQKIYAQNDENYAIAIYEGIDKKGKIKRSYEPINNLKAGAYYKLSKKEFRQNYDMVTNPHDKTGFPLKYILKKGMMVLFYEEHPEEVFDLEQKEIYKRLYKLSKFDTQGRLTFRTHFEARQASKLKEVYTIDFDKPFEQIRLQVSKLNIMVEGYEFKISPSGKIKFL